MYAIQVRACKHHFSVTTASLYLANIDVRLPIVAHAYRYGLRYTLQRGEIDLEQIDQTAVAAVELIILSSCHVITYHNSRLLISKQVNNRAC